ncbi:MAG: hypothetical protein K0R29_2664 [Pseudobdellovibrio sp.]|jgi:hypothetical protein|nr:hypothetical protein [Pseudobdellovibrio sp.]
MKTESEYQQLFLENCAEQNPSVQEISKHYWIDMTSHLSTYFSHESRTHITVKAAGLLNEKMAAGTSAEDGWKEVIRDFLANNYWQQPVQIKKPEVKKTEEQKNFSTLLKYGFALFLLMFVMKIAVTIFGIRGSINPDRIDPVWTWIFFGLSLVMMVFIAYRLGKSED